MIVKIKKKKKKQKEDVLRKKGVDIVKTNT